MDQKFEGTPEATICLEGNRLIRSHVSNDWGLRLQWKIAAGEKTVAEPLARVSDQHELGQLEPGTYSAVLQMWKYVNYKKDKDGEFTVSKFVVVSNRVGFEVAEGGSINEVELPEPAEPKPEAAAK